MTSGVLIFFEEDSLSSPSAEGEDTEKKVAYFEGETNYTDGYVSLSFSLKNADGEYVALQNGEQGVEIHLSLAFLKLVIAQSRGFTTSGLSRDVCNTVNFSTHTSARILRNNNFSHFSGFRLTYRTVVPN